jgi:phosphomannomutase/phosphoglucomutase
LTRDVLKHNPGATIISEVKSSHRLYQDIEQHGGRPLMWKTGHSLIKEKMKSTGALLAGEMSGHIFFSDRYFGYDDAIYASARLIEILSGEDRSLSALLSNLPPSVATPEIRIDCPDNIKFELVERMRAALKNKFGSPEYKFTEIDGVRVDSGEGWGLIRASNTQPVLVMRFEASTQARLDEIRNAFAGTLKLVGQETGNVLHV